MRGYLTVLCCAALVIFYSDQPTSAAKQKTSSISDELVGCWQLISIETVRPNGEVIYPFYGKHPEGLLMYDRDGWMSVQIVSDPKPTAPQTSSREGFLAAASSEKAAAIDGYYAYFGTWSVDPSGATVTHHIRQSLYPGERGEEGVRRLRLQGDRLTLTAKTHEMGEEHERRLVWERTAPVH
jgi:Lipocalin-like domain